MPGSKPGSAKPKTPTNGSAKPQEDGDELLGRLAEKEAALGCTQERIERLATAQAALDGERQTLGTQLTAERTQFGDVNSYLKHALAEQTERAEGLERQLADAHRRIQEAAEAGAAAATAAEQRRLAEVEEKQATLDGAAQRIQQADAYLAERDSLKSRAQQLEEQLEEQKRQHHTRQMDLERKHASDRELWRRETAEAVAAAREEMAALTDQRLEATTRQTLVENEEMAGELQYQGRHVQALLACNSALQKQVGELRVALGIARTNEEELARKALACEKTIEALLARLAGLEAQRDADADATAELQEQLVEAQEEARAALLRQQDQQAQVEELEEALNVKRQELRQLRGANDDSASFLLACMADARQELLAQQGHAELAGVIGMPHRQLAHGEQQGNGSSSNSSSGSFAAASGCGAAGEGTAANRCTTAAGAGAPQVALAQLPLQQREAVLQRLLERLQVDWRRREGLVLPSSSSSSICSTVALGETTASGQRQEMAGSRAGARGLAATSSISSSSRCVGVISRAASSKCASSELLQLVMSDVRPWGSEVGAEGGSAAAAGGRKVPGDKCVRNLNK